MTEREHIHNLSILLLRFADVHDVAYQLAHSSENDRAQMRNLASTHHVLLRAFQPLMQAAEELHETALADWARTAMEEERSENANSLRYLNEICRSLESGGYPTTVIKSL